MKVEIFTDGAARGNPNGPGGYGTVIRCVDRHGTVHEREFSQGFIQTTNNRMELMAAIAGLESLRYPCEVELYSDSQYLVNAYNLDWITNWRKKNFMRGSKSMPNADLWIKLDGLVGRHKVSFNWVKGHAGHPENERCDKLATTAADGDELIADTGFDLTERE